MAILSLRNSIINGNEVTLSSEKLLAHITGGEQTDLTYLNKSYPKIIVFKKGKKQKLPKIVILAKYQVYAIETKTLYETI